MLSHNMTGHWKPKPSESTAVFLELDFILNPLPEYTSLNKEKDVIEASLKGLPLSAKTEIYDEQRNMRAEIDYPIKTMNFLQDRDRFQVDTGPVLLPDLTSVKEHWIDRLELAHVVYNTYDRAEFIVREPVPVKVNGKEAVTVPEYSSIKVHRARHTLICAGNI